MMLFWYEFCTNSSTPRGRSHGRHGVFSSTSTLCGAFSRDQSSKPALLHEHQGRTYLRFAHHPDGTSAREIVCCCNLQRVALRNPSTRI